MKPPATGCPTSGCRAKAASAAGSLPCLPERAGWVRLPHCSTRLAIVSRGSSSPSSCPSGWERTCSSPGRPNDSAGRQLEPKTPMGGGGTGEFFDEQRWPSRDVASACRECPRARDRGSARQALAARTQSTARGHPRSLAHSAYVVDCVEAVYDSG